MVDIITRAGKGAPLTHTEMDTNLTNIKTALEVPSDPYGTAVLADSPLAYYRMRDDTGATTLEDSSGNVFNATLSSACVIPGRSPVASNINGAAFFASGVYATLPPGVQSNFPSSPWFSMEAWVKVQAATNKWSGILGFGPDTTNKNSVSLFTSTTDALLKPAALVASTTDTTYGIAQSPYAIPLNEWVYLVGTYDGATIKLYIDGALTASTAYANTSIVAISRPLARIASDNENEYTNNAMIAEVALYNTCLSAAQVAAHYAASLKG